MKNKNSSNSSIMRFFKKVRAWFLGFVLKNAESGKLSESQKENAVEDLSFNYILTPEELADTSKVSDSFFQRQLLLDILQTMSIFTTASIDALNTSASGHKDGKNAPVPVNLLGVYFSNIFDALALGEKLLVAPKDSNNTPLSSPSTEAVSNTTGEKLTPSLSTTPAKKVGKQEFSQLLLGKRVKLMEQEEEREGGKETSSSNTALKKEGTLASLATTKPVDKPN